MVRNSDCYLFQIVSCILGRQRAFYLLHILMTIHSKYIFFHVNDHILHFSVGYVLNNLCCWFLIIGYVFYKLANHFSDIMSYCLFDQILDMFSVYLFIFFFR